MESNNDNDHDSKKKKRKYNSVKRKKILSKIKKIKDKGKLKEILKIIKKDLGDNISKNSNGFFFDMNNLSDTSISNIINILKEISITATSDSEIKFTYTPYENQELSTDGFGPKLSNKEKNLLKNKKK